MKIFTKEELSYFNGEDGKPSYIGFEGKVYDVTKSFLWMGGKHQALHRAGEDLTDALKNAPHGSEFIKKFPMVGVLKD